MSYVTVKEIEFNFFPSFHTVRDVWLSFILTDHDQCSSLRVLSNLVSNRCGGYIPIAPRNLRLWCIQPLGGHLGAGDRYATVQDDGRKVVQSIL